MRTLDKLVHVCLAAHLRLPTTEVDDREVVADLGLMPLDLVWIAMRVEALVLGPCDFPMDRLSKVVTVGDLVQTFDQWAGEREMVEDLDSLVPDHGLADWLR